MQLGNIGESRNWHKQELEVGGGGQFCSRQADSQWVYNAFQGLELAGGQLRGPDKTQMLRDILRVVSAGAQRGMRIEGGSAEGCKVGHFFLFNMFFYQSVVDIQYYIGSVCDLTVIFAIKCSPQ